MSHVDERPPRPGNRAYSAARQTPRTPAAGRTTRRPFRPPPPRSCVARLHPRQERDFQDDKRESPGDVLVPSGTTSGRTSHMASLRVAARGAWPPHPQWAKARHAITLAVKRGRDHQAKGDTEAATRPTPRAGRDPRSAPPCASPPSSTGHTTTAARDRRLMPAETIRPPAHGRRGTNGLVLSLLGVRVPPGGVEI